MTASKSSKLVDYRTGSRYAGKAELVSRAQVATRLGRSLPYVSSQVKAGAITPVARDARTGAWYFRRVDVDAYVRKGGR